MTGAFKTQRKRKIMKGLSCHIFILAAVILAAGCSNDKKAADTLFREAEGLAQSAQSETKRSFIKGLRLYEDAAGKAVKITEEYPDLQLAKGLRNGEKKVGPYSLEELRKTVIPGLRGKAAAEGDFLACALLVSERVEDPKKRLVDLNRIVSAKTAKVADYEGARKALEGMEPGPLLAETRATISERLVASGKFDEALSTAREIGNASLRRSNLEGVAAGMAAAGECEKAAEIAGEIKDPFFRDDALKDIALGCAKAGRFDSASKLTDGIQDPKKKSETLTGLAESLGKQGRAEEASSMLSRAIQAAGNIEAPFSKSYVLGIIILRSPTIQPRHYDAMLDIIEHMEESTHKVFQLAGIAGRYADEGRKEKALELLSRALDMTDRVTYGPPPDIPRVDLVGFIARQYVDAGEYERAMEIAESLKQGTQESSLFGATRPMMLLAAEFAEKGHYKEAYQLIDSGGRGHEKIGPILKMYEAAMKSEQKTQADTLLEKAADVVATIGAMNLRADGYVDIARKYFDMGEKGKASFFLSKALETAEYIMIDTKKMRSLEKILGSPALEIKHCNEAIELAEVMGEGPFQKKAFLMIAVKYAELGDVENALGIAGGVEDEGLRTKALLDIGESQLKKGQRDKGLAALADAMTIAQRTVPKDARSQADMLLTFAGVYSRGNEKEKAAPLLARAEELVKGLEKREDRDSMYFLVAAMYMEMGMGKSALETGMKIVSPEKMVDTLVMASEGYAKSGLKIGDDEKGILHGIINRVSES